MKKETLDKIIKMHDNAEEIRADIHEEAVKKGGLMLRYEITVIQVIKYLGDIITTERDREQIKNAKKTNEPTS